MKNIRIEIPAKENGIQKNKRRKYNNKILKIVKDFLKENPEFKFVQCLFLLGVVTNIDRYDEESEITYKRIINKLTQMKNMKFKAGINELH